MKKSLVSVICSLGLVSTMGLAGCAGSPQANDSESHIEAQEEEAEGEKTAETEFTEEQQAILDAKAQEYKEIAENKADAPSEYKVTIEGINKTTDAQGDSAVGVDFHFINDSGEEVLFPAAVQTSVTQNGKQLEVTGGSGLGVNMLAVIQPGDSTNVVLGYKLIDESPVKVVCTTEIDGVAIQLAEKTFDL